MNQLLKHYVSVEGIDNALELAKVLIKNNYQVFIQLDDCDIYIVSYEYNDSDFEYRFAAITDEEEAHIAETRELEADNEKYGVAAGYRCNHCNGGDNGNDSDTNNYSDNDNCTDYDLYGSSFNDGSRN